MATVYRAFQPALNRYVAIKVLKTVMAGDAEFIARFRQEALAAGGLEHPNILRIYDADTFEGRQYIVMALATGGSLADRVSQGPLAFDEAAEMTAQIAGALGYAHRRGIVHRDIKPSNVLLDEEGRPLLADFGIAKATAAGQHLTMTGASIGTPGYMSPEQAEGLAVDGRSDLFSLAIVLYQMVTGKLPFQGDTSMAVMFQIVHQTPPPVRQIASTVPEYLESIIQKAMAKRPADRFPSGQEMAQALHERRVVEVPPSSGRWDGRAEGAWGDYEGATSAYQRVTPSGRDRAPAERGAPTPRGGQAQRPATPTPHATDRRRPANRGLLVGLLALLLVAVLGGGGYAAWLMLGQPKGAERIAAGTVAPLAAAMPSPLPVTPTLPATEPATSTRIAGGVGGVMVATSVPSATATPTAVPTASATALAASSPTLVPVAAATATAPPAPTATRAPAPPATTAVSVAAAPGVVLDFESFGAWRRGDQPYGAFEQTAERKRTGQFAAKLAYQFPAVTDNYVVFCARPPRPSPVNLGRSGCSCMGTAASISSTSGCSTARARCASSPSARWRTPVSGRSCRLR